MDSLKYISTERYMEGIIVELKSGSVGIDLKGRLGYLKIPVRMLITEYALAVGMEVGFMMSFPEVLRAEINPNYKTIIEKKASTKADMDQNACSTDAANEEDIDESYSD